MAKVKSAQEIQQEIENVKTQQEEFRQQLEQIEQKMAQNWGKDTSDLESQYGTVHVKLRVSDRVLGELGAARRDAEKREKLDEYRALAKEYPAFVDARDRARERVEQAEVELQEAKKDLERAKNSLTARHEQVKPEQRQRFFDEQYASKGIQAADLEAIRAEIGITV